MSARPDIAVSKFVTSEDVYRNDAGVMLLAVAIKCVAELGLDFIQILDGIYSAPRRVNAVRIIFFVLNLYAQLFSMTDYWRIGVLPS